MSSVRPGALPRDPTRRLCLLALRQGQRPLEPVNGFVLRGGPTRTLRGRGWPSPENKPQLIDCKGLSPLLGVQGAKPPGGVSGRSPDPSPARTIALRLEARALDTRP